MRGASGPYRDGLEARAEQHATRLAEVDARVARMTPKFFELTAPGTREYLSRLHDDARLAKPSDGELQRAGSALSIYEESVGRVLMSLAELERSLSEPLAGTPDLALLPRSVPPVGLVGANRPALRSKTARALWVALEGLSPLVTVDETSNEDFVLAAPIVAGVPYAVSVEPLSELGASEMRAMCHVPRGLGRIYVCGDGFVERTLEALHLRPPDHVLGEARFDQRFRVEGDDATVRAAIDPSAREALMTLSRHELATLIVDDGVARLVWKGELRRRFFSAAFRLLGHVRATRPRLDLIVRD